MKKEKEVALRCRECGGWLDVITKTIDDVRIITRIRCPYCGLVKDYANLPETFIKEFPELFSEVIKEE